MTYEQPAAGDKILVQMGDPNDIQPLGRLSENLETMSITIDMVHADAPHMSGSFEASWADEGGDYGEISGTFDVSGWE